MDVKLIQICESKINKGFNLEETKDFVVSIHGEDVWLRIKDSIEKCMQKKVELGEKNKPYWMLICNPLMWGEGTEEYEVNKLLYDLNEESIEPWKINQRTDMELQMKEGHRGIIKVSEDKRTEVERYDDEGNIVAKLMPGIYGIFEVVQDEDGDCTFETENGNWFVNIKVIDNFYAQGKIIPKEKSRELLGVNVYNSIPSTKIDKKLFENVLNSQTK